MRREIFGVTSIERSQKHGVALPRQGFHFDGEGFRKANQQIELVNTNSHVMREKNESDKEVSNVTKFYDRIEKHFGIEQ